MLIQNFLACTGKSKPGHIKTPKQQFFTVLSKPDIFAQFVVLINPPKKHCVENDDWLFLNYYFAFLYALRSTEVGKRFIHDEKFDIFQSQEKQWCVAVSLLFTKSSFLKGFISCKSRYMQSVNIHLTIPVRMLLNKLFGKSRKLLCYDYGCGLNIDLPLLASKYNPQNYHLPVNEMLKYNCPVSISKGIGVDLNPVDLEWVKACTSSLALTKEQAVLIDRELDCLVNLRKDNSDRFPIINTDFFQFVPKIPADFVLTKKMRYQHEKEKQSDIKKLINMSLKENGYWITVAEENYHSEGRKRYLENTYDEIWVYKKQNAKLIRVSNHPLIEVSRSSGGVISFDTDLFGVSKTG